MKRGVQVGILFVAGLADARAWAGKEAKSATTSSESVVPFAAVDASDGIEASEARAIADEYFEQEYGSCGGTDTFRRRGRTWVFSILFGVTGEKLKETIRVDAKTGGVWSAGGPRYRDLRAFREKTTADEARSDRAEFDAVDHGTAAGGAVAKASKSSLEEVPEEFITALHYAIRGGYAKIVVLLLDAGADPRRRREGKETPLELARQSGNPEIVRVVEERLAHSTGGKGS